MFKINQGVKLNTSFLSFLVFLLALFFRFSQAHHPFWVDEFSSASQALLLLKQGFFKFNNPNFYFEYHNITTHGLIALSFKLFGISEFSARLPFMLIGSLIPVLLFLLGKKMFNFLTGLIAGLLATFSYFFITWSKQARGYVLLQVLILFLFYFYFKNFKNKKVKILTLALISILGILTHTMFLFAVLALLIHYFIYNYKSAIGLFKKTQTYLILFVFILLLWSTGLLNYLFINILAFLKSGPANNLHYYHSFLWREHTLIFFLALIGLSLAFLKKRRLSLLIIIHSFLHLVFLTFIFKPYVSRYLLPIFSYLYLGTAYCLVHFSKTLFTKNKNNWKVTALTLLISFFIIVNGHKFTLMPKNFYSVNHDFREIALIDYDKIYQLIKDKSKNNKTAVIDTWPDRLFWYLGDDYPASYTFRWEDAGLMKKTPFILNKKGEKLVKQMRGIRLISELDDIKKAISQYPQGFIWIDDTTLPQDVISHAQNNMTKELYLDHYTYDDNPYSIWPGILYSWGFE